MKQLAMPSMFNYEYILLLLGISFFGAAWLPTKLARSPVSLPLLWLIIGLLLPFLLPDLPQLNLLKHTILTERLTEFAVLISLIGAGLKIDKKMGWKQWADTWLLLAFTLPLSIIFLTIGAYYLLLLPFALAMLLGAAMAPTDPVLASYVQVGPPGMGNEDDVRFALTSEAGFNDALAFPFVYLALLSLTLGITQSNIVTWFLNDIIFKIFIGITVGLVVGRSAAYCFLQTKTSQKIDGFLAIALMLVTYSITQLLHGYGFIAVFLAARAFRGYRRNHKHHLVLHDFTNQIERLLILLLLLVIGISITQGLFRDLSWEEISLAFLFILIIRPGTALISLTGSSTLFSHKLAISFFGIRGISSFYYLAFAFNYTNVNPVYERKLWSICTLIVLISIILHSISKFFIWPKLVKKGM